MCRDRFCTTDDFFASDRRNDARQLLRSARVDRFDSRMRVRTAHNSEMAHPGQRDIADERTLARGQDLVGLARNSFAYVLHELAPSMPRIIQREVIGVPPLPLLNRLAAS